MASKRFINFRKVLLTKAEGVSRFVYPALSLNVCNSTCKEINNMFVRFVWKYKRHHLKKTLLFGPKAKGGFDLLDFMDLNYKFKVRWWKLCHSHNFSPHKSIIWNSECIIKRSKSLYLQNWIDKNIIYMKDLFSSNGQTLRYEDFLRQKTFPIKFKEFSLVINSVPRGIKELMKSYKKQNVQNTISNTLHKWH